MRIAGMKPVSILFEVTVEFSEHEDFHVILDECKVLEYDNGDLTQRVYAAAREYLARATARRNAINRIVEV